MPEERKYYESINLARGLAIVLVVIGHGTADIFSMNGVWDNNNNIAHYLFLLIYSFHMPLFIFLSGFCNVGLMELKSKQDALKFIKKRFSRLMIPYLIWGIIYVPLDIVGGNYSVQEFSITNYIIDLLKGDNANWQLWTLYTLFICVLFAILFFYLCKLPLRETVIVSGIIFVTYTLLCGRHILPLYLFITIISTVILYFFFFTLGMYVRKRDLIHKLEGIPNLWIIIMTAGLLINALVFLVYDPDSYWTKLYGAPAGICIILFAAAKIKNKKIKHIVNTLGTHCMDIYILANLCQVIIRKIVNRITLFQNIRIMGLILSVIFGICIPILLYHYIFSKWKITRKLLFGNS